MTAKSTWLVNGISTDSLPLSDRGLAYGDGLFETLVARPGCLPAWDKHSQRLSQGCLRLGIHWSDTEQVAQEAEQLLAANGAGVIKVIITRGSGGRGYMPDPNAKATRIVSWHPAPAPRPEAAAGVTIRLCHTQIAQQPLLAGLKHLNRLEQVMARQEWSDPAIADGLLLDVEGNVIEGTMSNVFIQRAGEILTPALDHCGVSGIMRARLLEMLPASTATISLPELLGAEYVWLCNSVIGLWPVRQIDMGRLSGNMMGAQLIDFKVGSLQQEVQQMLHQEDGIKR